LEVGVSFSFFSFFIRRDFFFSSHLFLRESRANPVRIGHIDAAHRLDVGPLRCVHLAPLWETPIDYGGILMLIIQRFLAQVHVRSLVHSILSLF
jgi:hypothetical protein